jgi:hypothetical protein
MITEEKTWPEGKAADGRSTEWICLKLSAKKPV